MGGGGGGAAGVFNATGPLLTAGGGGGGVSTLEGALPGGNAGTVGADGQQGASIADNPVTIGGGGGTANGGASTGGGGGGGYGAGGGGAGGGGGGSSWVSQGATSVSSVLMATPGNGKVSVSYDTTADSCATVLPGSGIVAAPTAGTADLAVAVTLDQPSPSTVTVAWNTLYLPGIAPNPWLGPEAPTTDYAASSGTVTFTPGQTSTVVHIPVLADSNPTSPDEFLMVSFHDPANAHMGGFWGLGFGVITPATT